ncbi:hypothetical protein Poli38472_005896 [Pythium oligandrum]|uniref:F-box domain-containing protein n=1 Tax=Pythium oligandrum TaxID=41045 RepID=A0A8K1FSD1_PYTOL|nr:hypothetical protein Poli38472_005896 [Pythium oligandrum]|eukprot:TMW68428.1 hypothetical protein Poli38472_005896 [Pythium oligandrum]
MERIDSLPTVLLTAILEFSDHQTLHNAERSCSLLRMAAKRGDVWELLARRRVVMRDEDDDQESHDTLARAWKAIACMAQLPCGRGQKLLRDVVACSSIDRPVETPTNTLHPSRCWIELRSLSDRATGDSRADDEDVTRRNHANVAQMQCGCEMGQACYWSSAPSTDRNTRDFIDYRVQPGCMVSRFQIIPYRAYWHPESPTYAPFRVSVAFYAHSREDASSISNLSCINSAHKHLLYESPPFQLINDMQLQEFELPRHVWLPHGAIMRLNVLGRYQAETIDAFPWLPDTERTPHYYACLSFVDLLGVTVPETVGTSLHVASIG